MLASDVWGSIVKKTQDLLIELRQMHPEAEIRFLDWETHANIEELPECDLVGPTALNITEHSPQLVEVNFAIAVSTYGSDENLFRHRAMISRIFEHMRSMKQITLYDAATATPKGFMIFTDGTTILPMSRAQTRPWQYVQSSCLLEPTSLKP